MKLAVHFAKLSKSLGSCEHLSESRSVREFRIDWCFVPMVAFSLLSGFGSSGAYLISILFSSYLSSNNNAGYGLTAMLSRERAGTSICVLLGKAQWSCTNPFAGPDWHHAGCWVDFQLPLGLVGIVPATAAFCTFDRETCGCEGHERVRFLDSRRLRGSMV